MPQLYSVHVLFGEFLVLFTTLLDPSLSAERAAWTQARGVGYRGGGRGAAAAEAAPGRLASGVRSMLLAIVYGCTGGCVRVHDTTGYYSYSIY